MSCAEQALRQITAAIADILADNRPTIYLHGSMVLEDFRPGWSDIDLLCLTETPLRPDQAKQLLILRQTLTAKEPDNPFFRSCEGGILTLDAFLSGAPDWVVYWGTSGQRLDTQYHFDCFSRLLLLDQGQVLHGTDQRHDMERPDREELRRGAKARLSAVRKHGRSEANSLYGFGWLLDIARCLYTLHTNSIASKTMAGEWSLAEGLCPCPQAMAAALRVREDPSLLQRDPVIQAYAASLTPDIQRFADVLEKTLF